MKIISKIKKKFFCDKGKHNWEYWIAGNRIIEVDGGHAFADIPMRQCKDCKRWEEKWFDNLWRLYKKK